MALGPKFKLPLTGQHLLPLLARHEGHGNHNDAGINRCPLRDGYRYAPPSRITTLYISTRVP